MVRLSSLYTTPDARRFPSPPTLIIRSPTNRHRSINPSRNTQKNHRCRIPTTPFPTMNLTPSPMVAPSTQGNRAWAHTIAVSVPWPKRGPTHTRSVVVSARSSSTSPAEGEHSGSTARCTTRTRNFTPMRSRLRMRHSPQLHLRGPRLSTKRSIGLEVWASCPGRCRSGSGVVNQHRRRSENSSASQASWQSHCRSIV